MISIVHKLTGMNEQQTAQAEVAQLVSQYRQKDGFSHHRVVTLPASSQQILLTFWLSKKHYRRAIRPSS